MECARAGKQDQEGGGDAEPLLPHAEQKPRDYSEKNGALNTTRTQAALSVLADQFNEDASNT